MKPIIISIVAALTLFGSCSGTKSAHADSWAAYQLGSDAIREIGAYLRSREGYKTYAYSENRQINNDNPIPYGPPVGMFGSPQQYRYDTSYGRGGGQTLPATGYDDRWRYGYGGVRYDPHDCFVSRYDGQRYCRQIQ